MKSTIKHVSLLVVFCLLFSILFPVGAEARKTRSDKGGHHNYPATRKSSGRSYSGSSDIQSTSSRYHSLSKKTYIITKPTNYTDVTPYNGSIKLQEYVESDNIESSDIQNLKDVELKYSETFANIVLDGKLIEIDQKPIFLNNTLMLPLDLLLDPLDAMFLSSSTVEDIMLNYSSIIVEHLTDVNFTTLNIGDTSVLIDNKEVDINMFPLIYNNHLMVPSDYIEKDFNVTIKYNGERNSVDITSNKNKGTITYVMDYEGIRLDLKDENDKDKYYKLAGILDDEHLNVNLRNQFLLPLLDSIKNKPIEYIVVNPKFGQIPCNIYLWVDGEFFNKKLLDSGLVKSSNDIAEFDLFKGVKK